MSAVLDRPAIPARIALALLGLACVLPFLSPIFLEPIGSFYGEATAFALGLAAFALMATRSLWAGARLPRIGLMFIGFAALMALQIALGGAMYSQLNLLGALYVLWAAALAMLGNRLVQVFGAATFVSVLAWFLLAGALISGLIGLIQLFGVQTPLAPFMLPQVHGRIYANTGQPNHLASYLCFGLASVGYLWSTRRLGTLLAVTTCAVFLAVLALSGSRAVWLYAAAFMLFAAVMRLSRPSVELTRLLIYSIAVIAGLLVAQWVMASIVPYRSTVLETIGSRVQMEGMSSPVRMRFWNDAWMMFRGAPIVGVGFKQFAWNHFLLTGKVAGAATSEGIIDNAHNLIFQIAAEFGVLGLALLFGGIGWWGWSLRRVAVDASLWWMASVLGVLGLHSMLEYPLWYAYFLGIAAMVMGAAESGSPSVHDKSSGRIILCMVVLLGLVAFTNVYRDYRVMQSLQRMANHEPATASDPESVRVLLDLQRSSLFSPFIEFALARRMSLNQEHLKDKIVLNQRAMHFQPSSDFAYRQVLLLALSGDVAGMREQWDLAVANYPNERAEVLKVAQELDKSGENGIKQLLSYVQQENGKAEK